MTLDDHPISAYTQALPIPARWIAGAEARLEEARRSGRPDAIAAATAALREAEQAARDAAALKETA